MAGSGERREGGLLNLTFCQNLSSIAIIILYTGIGYILIKYLMVKNCGCVAICTCIV